MKKIKPKILMCGDVVVDGMMLDQGIYATSRPNIYYDADISIENMKAVLKTLGYDTPNRMENLSKCRLVEVTITMADSVPCSQKPPATLEYMNYLYDRVCHKKDTSADVRKEAVEVDLK